MPPGGGFKAKAASGLILEASGEISESAKIPQWDI
jgi:hypothetical protein